MNRMADSVENLVGTVKDLAFIDEISVRIVAMNEPVSFFNAAIGREMTWSLLLNFLQYIYIVWNYLFLKQKGGI